LLLQLLVAGAWIICLCTFLFLFGGSSGDPALPMAAEVGVLAFEALVVIQVVEGEFRNVLEVLALWIFQTLVQIEALVLGAELAFSKNFDLQFLGFVYFVFEPRVTRCRHPLVARGAKSILETNSEVIPTLVKPCPDAVHVEDMLALKLDDGFLPESLDVAH
jgi:hypothetical protein